MEKPESNDQHPNDLWPPPKQPNELWAIPGFPDFFKKLADAIEAQDAEEAEKKE